MRLYEKIFIWTIIVLVGLRVFNIDGSSTYLFATIILFAFSYFFGGYYLLTPKETSRDILSIYVGFSLGLSVFALRYLLILSQNKYLYLFLIPNLITLLILLFYWLKLRKENPLNPYKKLLLKRTLFVALVTSFFAFTPRSFSPYRNILYYLNNGDIEIQNNLLMVEYTEICEEAYKNKDYDKAIEYGVKANICGLKWLNLENKNKYLLNNDTIKKKLLPISRTFSNLYNAYRKKGDYEYSLNNYNEALINYQNAYKYLGSTKYLYKSWETEKSWALSNMAFCYKNLNDYTFADSLFVKAIENYRKVNDSLDNGLANLYNCYAKSLSEQMVYPYSNIMHKGAIAIYFKDSTNKDTKNEIATSYLGLSENFIQQDSVFNAFYCIKRALHFSSKDFIEYNNILLQYGICYFKLDKYEMADSIIKVCLNSTKESLTPFHQNIAECNLLLAKINIALGKYNDAKGFINKGIEITIKNFGLQSGRYANYLKVLAVLNSLQGEYLISERQFHQVIELYTKELGYNNKFLPEVLSNLAYLEVQISKFKQAKVNSDNSLSIASKYITLDKPFAIFFLNNAAYIDYCNSLYKPADTLYRKTLFIDKKYGSINSSSTAIALNGLGLVEMAKKKYAKADSLFSNSLHQHILIFKEFHPLTATVYLNYAKLKILQNDLILAQVYLNKSFDINSEFFDKSHDVFGDIYVAFGDIEKKKKNIVLSKDYYRKALVIYSKKFDNNHWKVISTRKNI